MLSQKIDKQLVKNYCPICKVSICGEMFECLLCHSLFDFLIQNDVISPTQARFKPGDTCVNQLSSIMHEIYHSMDEVCKIGNVFSCYNKSKGHNKGLVFTFKET